LWRAVIADGVAGLCRELDEPSGRELLTVATWVRCLPQRADLLRVLVHALLAPGSMRDFTLTELAPVWERLRGLQRRARGAAATDEQLAMWLGASLALPVFAAMLPPLDERSTTVQRDLLHAWLTQTGGPSHAGPFSLAAARARLRG
jgi:hypothetical protein